MRAFPDPEKPKAFYIERVRRHREADELVRGTGWSNRHGLVRGCAVGCTLEQYNHALYPELLGVPEQIAHLQDWLFENLPEGHLTWPERFLGAIPEGADLSGVYPAWVVRLMTRNLDRLGSGEEPWQSAVRASITEVKDLFEAGIPDDSAGRSAESAAWAAAWAAAAWAAESAADSAAWAAAARSAESAADSAAWAAAARSAESAADSAAWAAAAWAAESAADSAAEILFQAEDLLELLRNAPFP